MCVERMNKRRNGRKVNIYWSNLFERDAAHIVWLVIDSDAHKPLAFLRRRTKTFGVTEPRGFARRRLRNAVVVARRINQEFHLILGRLVEIDAERQVVVGRHLHRLTHHLRNGGARIGVDHVQRFDTGVGGSGAGWFRRRARRRTNNACDGIAVGAVLVSWLPVRCHTFFLVVQCCLA